MLLTIGQRKRSNREGEVEQNCKKRVTEKGKTHQKWGSREMWSLGRVCVYIYKHLSCSGCFGFYPVLLGWVKSPLSLALEEEAEGCARPFPLSERSAHGLASETFAANRILGERHTPVRSVKFSRPGDGCVLPETLVCPLLVFRFT